MNLREHIENLWTKIGWLPDKELAVSQSITDPSTSIEKESPEQRNEKTTEDEECNEYECQVINETEISNEKYPSTVRKDEENGNERKDSKKKADEQPSNRT